MTESQLSQMQQLRPLPNSVQLSMPRGALPSHSLCGSTDRTDWCSEFRTWSRAPPLTRRGISTSQLFKVYLPEPMSGNHPTAASHSNTLDNRTAPRHSLQPQDDRREPGAVMRISASARQDASMFHHSGS